MPAAEDAIDALEELGLTEYEARCFVALTRLSSGTAREIGQVADVPRSRVYDTVERLDRRGLVSVQQSDPREYCAVSVESACRRLREDFDSRVQAAEDALERVEKPDPDREEGMWAISRNEHVTDRIVTFLDDASSSIHHLVVDEGQVDDRLRAGLQAAAERGVDVLVEVPTEDDSARLREDVPDATVVVAPSLDTTNPVYGERPAQLVLVDRLAVVATGEKDADLPGVTNETAVWTYGHDHGFAAWVRELLDDRREVGCDDRRDATRDA